MKIFDQKTKTSVQIISVYLEDADRFNGQLEILTLFKKWGLHQSILNKKESFLKEQSRLTLNE